MIEPRPEPLYMSGPEMRFHHIQTTCDPCKLTGFHRCDLIKSHHLMFLIASFFPANETALLKHSNQTNFKAYLKKSIKLQENERQNFATFYKPAHYTGSIKYLYSRKNSCIERLNFAIQNRCDKVVIELRLLQLWTEIVMILVI